jgi:type 1 glutamine amidotransferase
VPTVALVSGSLEYKSDESLAGFQPTLERLGWTCRRFFRRADDDVPGLDHLTSCDLAVFYTRRLTISGPQLDAVKAYCGSGKPVVGVRSASHGFQTWLAMDREVFGGDYQRHYGAGPTCAVVPVTGVSHPVLTGVGPFTSAGSLYKNPSLKPDVTVLLTGTAAGKTEPVAWVRERPAGGKTQRVFYTSVGHPDDFAVPAFVRLLTNAVAWAGGASTAGTRSAAPRG